MWNYAAVFGERILILLAAFCANVLLVNALSDSDYGIVRWLISIVSISAMLSFLSLDAMLIRFIPELRSQKDKRFLSVVLITLLLRIVSVLIILQVLPNVIIAGIEKAGETTLDQRVIIILLIYFFVMAINNIIGRAFLTGMGYRGRLAWLLVLQESARLLILLFFWANNAVDVPNALLTYLYSEILLFIIYLVCFVRMLTLYEVCNRTLEQVKIAPRITKYILGNSVGQFGQSLRLVALDLFMLGLMVSSSAVAAYSVAAVFPNLFRSFSPYRLFSGLLIPQMTQKNEPAIRVVESASGMLIFVEKLICSFYLGAGFLVAGLSFYLIPFIFSDTYNDVYYISFILMLSTLFVCLTDIYILKSQLLENNLYISKFTIYTGLSNVALNLFLIPRFGLLGAAISTLLVSIFGFLFYRSLYSAHKATFLMRWHLYFYGFVLWFVYCGLLFFSKSNLVLFVFIVLLWPVYSAGVFYALSDKSDRVALKNIILRRDFSVFNYGG